MPDKLHSHGSLSLLKPVFYSDHKGLGETELVGRNLIDLGENLFLAMVRAGNFGGDSAGFGGRVPLTGLDKAQAEALDTFHTEGKHAWKISGITVGLCTDWTFW